MMRVGTTRPTFLAIRNTRLTNPYILSSIYYILKLPLLTTSLKFQAGTRAGEGIAPRQTCPRAIQITPPAD